MLTKLFSHKFKNENKTVDMCTLPPCESVLRLHCGRANFLAVIWKRATLNCPDIPDIIYHGWNEDRCIVWVNEIFPDEDEEILVDRRYDPDDINNEQGVSDFDDEDEDVL